MSVPCCRGGGGGGGRSCARAGRAARSHPAATHAKSCDLRITGESSPATDYRFGSGWRTNFSVIRSLSPMATYFARSLSPSSSVGGSVHTPSA
jgi:hypothetical protein